MTMRTVEETVYKFSELSDAAKEVARNWWRECSSSDDWWDFVYDDAAQIAELMGIDLRTRPVKLMGGGVRYEPNIWFSGFCSQGDGACFEGDYSYRKGSVKAVKRHAPQDQELHAIVEGLYEIQKRNFYRVACTVQHRGHYSHSGCTEFDFDRSDCEVSSDDRDEVRKYLRRFMDWIYEQLETEHDWLNSDEQVDESIIANEYEFTESGDIH
jgi:hypothetical protein